MIRRTALQAFPAAIALALGGCANVTDAPADRLFPTGIEADERVSIILELHEGCNAGEADCRELLSQREFEDCLSDSLRVGELKLKTMPAEEFVRKTLLATNPHDVPRTSEALLQRLQDAQSRQVLAALRLHYIVVLKVRTTKTSARPVIAPGGSSVLVWGVGAEWVRVSSITAVILDAKEARLSGTLISSAKGTQGFAVPVVLIIPLPPVPFSSMTETSACKSLGHAVAEFILDKGGTEARLTRRPGDRR